VSNLGTPSSKVDPEVARFWRAVKMLIEGNDPLVRNSAVTAALRDLEAGLTPTPGIIPAPTGLVATGLFAKILLEWNAPANGGAYITEVFRSQTDDLGSAVMVLRAPPSLNMVVDDTLPEVVLAQTYYYWIRFASETGVSLFNQAAGTAATTADDPAYVLEILAGEITASELHEALTSRIDLIDADVSVENSVDWRVYQEALARAAALTQEISDRNDAILVETSNRILAIAQEVTDRDAAIATEVSILEGADEVEATKRETLSAVVTGVTDPTGLELGDLTAGLIYAESAVRASDVSAEASARLTLAAQLRGNYTGTDLNSLVSGLVYQEKIARVNQGDALAYSISMLSAGAGEQFDTAVIWFFDEDAEGWTGSSAPVVANGMIRPADTTDPELISPTGLAILSTTYRQTKARIKQTGAPTWAGRLYWKATTDETWDAARSLAITEPTFDLNGFSMITFDLEWTGTIDQIRVDLSSAVDASNYYEIDWIAIGRPSPGASFAALNELATASAQADAAQVSRLEILEATVNDGTTGVMATANALDTVELVVNSGTVGNNALASTLSGVSATLSQNITTSTENSITTINKPIGGSYSFSPTIIGCLKITLPQSWTGTMLRMEIDIATAPPGGGISFKVFCGGYNSASAWTRGFAQILGNKSGYNRVRFGHDGTKCCILIGDDDSTWIHPRVVVSNFKAAFSNYTYSLWGSGWAVSVVSDLTGYAISADFPDALLDAGTILNQGDLATLDRADLAFEDGADVTATAAAFTALEARVDQTEDDITANVDSISTLTATINDGTTGLSAAHTAITSLDGRVDVVEGVAAGNATDIDSLELAIENPTSGLAAAHTAITSLSGEVDTVSGVATGAATDIDALELVVNHATTGLAAAHTRITTLDGELDTVSGVATANAASIDQLQIDVDGSAAIIATEQLVRGTTAGPDWSSLTVYAVGKVVHRDGVLYQAIVANTDQMPPNATYWKVVTASLYAQHTVKTDVNGKVAGFGLANDGATSSFEIVADRFAICNTSGTGTKVPFVVDATYGVIMDTALVRKLTSTNIQADGIGADSISVATLSALSANMGTITAGTVTLSTGGFVKTLGTDGRYSILSGGDLSFYVGGSLYKNVRRVVVGEAVDADTITFNPAFYTTPKILVVPKTTLCYDPAYAASPQKLEFRAELVTVSGFKVVARHLRQGTASAQTVNYAFPVAANSVYTVHTTASNLTRVNLTMSGGTTAYYWVTEPGYWLYGTTPCTFKIEWSIYGSGVWTTAYSALALATFHSADGIIYTDSPSTFEVLYSVNPNRFSIRVTKIPYSFWGYTSEYPVWRSVSSTTEVASSVQGTVTYLAVEGS